MRRGAALNPKRSAVYTMYCPKGQTWAYTSARLRLLLCQGEVAERIWQVCPYELPLHELLLSLGHPALLSAKVFSLSWCLHSRLAPCSMSCTLGKINRSGMELLAFPPERSMSTTTLFLILPSYLTFCMKPIRDIVPELNLCRSQSMSLTTAKPLLTQRLISCPASPLHDVYLWVLGGSLPRGQMFCAQRGLELIILRQSP